MGTVFENLFVGGYLLFSIPMTFAVLVWLLTSVSTIGFSALDGILHLHAEVPGHDGGAHLEKGGVHQATESHGTAPDVATLGDWLGVGKIPFTLFITLLLFLYGWTGIFVKLLIPGVVGTFAGIAAGMFGGLLCTRGLAGLLQPLFKDYGKPESAHAFQGRIATLTSTTLSQDFGTALLKLQDGTLVNLSVRATEGASPSTLPKTGDSILLLEYLPEQNLYIAERFDAEEDADHQAGHQHNGNRNM